MSVSSVMCCRATKPFFARKDGVEGAWRVVDPILGNLTPLYGYDPGTWGPPEADRIITGDGSWHNPSPEEASE